MTNKKKTQQIGTYMTKFKGIIYASLGAPFLGLVVLLLDSSLIVVLLSQVG